MVKGSSGMDSHSFAIPRAAAHKRSLQDGCVIMIKRCRRSNNDLSSMSKKKERVKKRNDI